MGADAARAGSSGRKAGKQDWRKVKKLGSREAFFRTDEPDGTPLLVVSLFHKTASTSFSTFVRANLCRGPVEQAALPHEIGNRAAPGPQLDWYAGWYRGLEPERRARLRCVMSANAGYVLPALDRPAETLMVVREPVDRVISVHFDFDHRLPEDVERPVESLAAAYAGGGAWAVDRVGKAWDYFNGQSRRLLSMFHDVSGLFFDREPGDADLWRSRLREIVAGRLFVGVHDRIADFVDEVAARQGWEPFLPHAKVNANRPSAGEIPDELRGTIRAYNWLDAELYELARTAQAGRSAAAAAGRQ